MKLIILTGLPGMGKSRLAEAMGRQLAIPVFAKDWLEATLVRCELTPSNPTRPMGSAGYQLLTVLAERQLMLEQSVILDSVASTATIRDSWRKLGARYEVEWRVIECVCSNETVYRSRLSGRERNIPGWHELQWSDVKKVKDYFYPWVVERPILDIVNSFEENIARAIVYCE